MKRIYIFILSVIPFLLIGCSTARTYREVFKESPTYNSKEFPVSKNILYQATISVMCSRNFIIEEENKEKGFISGKRYFQKGKKSIAVMLQAKITSYEENKSTLYLNALQTTRISYIADRTRFFLWIIPLPGGGGREATEIKQEEITIKDTQYYQNFFSLVEKEIKILEEKSAAEKIESELEEDKTGLKEQGAEAEEEKGEPEEEDIDLEEDKGESEETKSELEEAVATPEEEKPESGGEDIDLEGDKIEPGTSPETEDITQSTRLSYYKYFNFNRL